MKIEIIITDSDLRQIVGQHIRKNFQVEVRNIDLTWAEPGGKNVYFVKVEGDYQPEQ